MKKMMTWLLLILCLAEAVVIGFLWNRNETAAVPVTGTYVLDLHDTPAESIVIGLDEEHKEYSYYNPAGTAIPSVTKETGQYEMTDPDTIRFLSGDLVNTVAVINKSDLFLVTDQKKVIHLLKKDHTYTAH